MVRCKKCGSEIPYGAKECDFCFNPLTEREIAEVEREHNQGDYFKKSAQQLHKKEERKKMLIIIPSIIVVIALVSIFFGKSIVNLAEKVLNKSVDKSLSGQLSEEDVLANIQAVALTALDYCNNHDIAQTTYKDLNEYLTAITIQNLSLSYPGAFDNSDIRIRTDGTKIIYIYHDGNIFERKGAYEKITLADK